MAHKRHLNVRNNNGVIILPHLLQHRQVKPPDAESLSLSLGSESILSFTERLEMRWIRGGGGEGGRGGVAATAGRN